MRGCLPVVKSALWCHPYSAPIHPHTHDVHSTHALLKVCPETQSERHIYSHWHWVPPVEGCSSPCHRGLYLSSHKDVFFLNFCNLISCGVINWTEVVICKVEGLQLENKEHPRGGFIPLKAHIHVHMHLNIFWILSNYLIFFSLKKLFCRFTVNSSAHLTWRTVDITITYREWMVH